MKKIVYLIHILAPKRLCIMKFLCYFTPKEWKFLIQCTHKVSIVHPFKYTIHIISNKNIFGINNSVFNVHCVWCHCLLRFMFSLQLNTKISWIICVTEKKYSDSPSISFNKTDWTWWLTFWLTLDYLNMIVSHATMLTLQIIVKSWLQCIVSLFQIVQANFKIID